MLDKVDGYFYFSIIKSIAIALLMGLVFNTAGAESMPILKF